MATRVHRKRGELTRFLNWDSDGFGGDGGCRSGGSAMSNLPLADTNLFVDVAQGAWVGGVAPQNIDVAVFDSNLGGITNNTYTWSVGSGTSNFWLGIQVLNPGGNISINDTANSLLLGSSGIDMSQATRNLAINAPLVLGGTQTWSTAAGVSLLVTGSVSMVTSALAISGAGNVSLAGSLTGGAAPFIMGGTGTLTLSGANAYSGVTTLQAGMTVLNYGSVGAGSGVLPSTSGLVFGKVFTSATVGGSSAVLTISGDPGFVVNQTFGSTAVAAGLATINAVTGQGAIVNLGALSKSNQNRGSSLRINASSGSVVSTFLTSTGDDGGYFVDDCRGVGDLCGLYDFAGIANGSVTIGTYPSNQSTGMSIAGGIINFQGSGTVTGTGDVTALRFNDNYTTQNYVVGSANQGFGGVLVTPNVGAVNVIISGTRSRFSHGRPAGDMVIWQNNTAGTLTFSNSAIVPVNGPSQFIKNGQGLVILANTGANTMQNWQINEGLIQVDSSSRFNSTGSAVTLDGGGVQFSASGSLTPGATLHLLQLGPKGGTLDVMPGVTLTEHATSGVQIIGSGMLTVADSGQFVVVASNNSYSGGTFITGTAVVNAVAGTPLGTRAAGERGGDGDAEGGGHSVDAGIAAEEFRPGSGERGHAGDFRPYAGA